MKIVIVTAALVLASTAAFADEREERSKLLGAWEAEGTSSTNGTWTFDEKGSGIHVTHSLGGRVVLDVECNTMGNECATQESGHKAKITMWYSADKLVELEAKGSDVVKHRFSAQGDAMEMEEIPVLPAGKSETVKYRRVQVASGERH